MLAIPEMSGRIEHALEAKQEVIHRLGSAYSVKRDHAWSLHIFDVCLTLSLFLADGFVLESASVNELIAEQTAAAGERQNQSCYAEYVAHDPIVID